MIFLGLSKLSHALLLKFAFTFIVSHFVADEGSVWSLTCSTKLFNFSDLIEAQQSLFLLSFHSYEVIPFGNYFFQINRYTHFFLATSLVATRLNSISLHCT